jgi:GST-like protein
MDTHLASHKFFADEYSIADMAIYPWTARYEWHRVDIASFRNVKRWYDEVGARPAVVKGMAVPPV